MTSLNKKFLDFNLRITVNLEGGNLIGDAGLLLCKNLQKKWS